MKHRSGRAGLRLRAREVVLRGVHQRLPAWHSQRVVFCSTSVPSDEVTVVYQNGLPVISVSLPSRRERCQFTLKPISDSVGVFLQQLQAEDRGIDRVAIYASDGTRIASSTGIDILLLDDFKLSINDLTYHVRPPMRDLLSHEDATTLNDLKTLVQQLYSTLRIEEHQLCKERELIGRLEELKGQLEPLEKVKEDIGRRAEKRTTWVLWGGLAYMATQFGILARLTWWEYSWDIMEPVTYFITYGSAMAMYAYFVLTRQEYIYPDARDRQYLNFFHKGAKKTRFDLEKYNQLKDAIAQVLPQIPEEARTIVSQAVTDGRDAAKFTIRCGLDMTDSLGDKDSALERLKDSRATARSLGLSTAHRPQQSAFRGHGRGSLSHPFSSHRATHTVQPLRGRERGIPRGCGTRNQRSAQSTPAPAAASKPS
ncbi:hypothetical protein NDU88_009252 [Pleurodeles waltl]|uniref:Calcium uniporter protein n=1 Tax=Pleurodeles waltl TaxID=8319 RepID=A0AAV7QX20_PLEWA|nr:hypothetical protein NDU88_009252 [Pleurodeles waltl]